MDNVSIIKDKRKRRKRKDIDVHSWGSDEERPEKSKGRIREGNVVGKRKRKSGNYINTTL
jgi:hypothetical protein